MNAGIGARIKGKAGDAMGGAAPMVRKQKPGWTWGRIQCGPDPPVGLKRGIPWGETEAFGNDGGAFGGRGMEFEHCLRDGMGGVAASGIGDGKRGFGNGAGGKLRRNVR